MEDPTREWQRPLGDSKRETGAGIVEANDGGFVTLGTTASANGDGDVIGNPNEVPDLWLVKLNAGVLNTSEMPSAIKNEVQIYPNPATERIFIDSEISVDRISIYTASGKLMSEYVSADAPIITKDLIPGVYFVHIRTKDGIRIKKLIKK